MREGSTVADGVQVDDLDRDVSESLGWSDQGLRAWRGETMVTASSARVWDALVSTPLLVGIVGKTNEVVWDDAPAEGAGVRFEIREKHGGIFEGTCLEFVQHQRLCVAFMRVERTGKVMRKVEEWVDSPEGESPQQMIVIGYTIEQRGPTTRVALELWTPDERLVFKNDHVMRWMMAIIGSRLYRRQIDKHLRQVRTAVMDDLARD